MSTAPKGRSTFFRRLQQVRRIFHRHQNMGVVCVCQEEWRSAFSRGGILRQTWSHLPAPCSRRPLGGKRRDFCGEHAANGNTWKWKGPAQAYAGKGCVDPRVPCGIAGGFPSFPLQKERRGVPRPSVPADQHSVLFSPRLKLARHASGLGRGKRRLRSSAQHSKSVCHIHGVAILGRLLLNGLLPIPA